MAYQTINPYTGDTLATFPDASDEQVSEAIAQAHEAFLQWRETPAEQRSRILTQAAALLRRDGERYASLLTLEMGKLKAEALAEVELSAQILSYFAQCGAELLKPRVLTSADAAVQEAVLVHEPLGVLLAIEPWNFPYYQIARILAPQLVAGNTLLLKHASNVPQCAQAFERLMRDAGLPQGAFRNLFATRTQIETIMADPRVQGLAFTGSEEAGSTVAALAGRNLKKVTLELGGADAFVVLADAELKATVDWAVFGRHWNGGQVCVSSKRMIIVEPVYKEFVRRYTEGVGALRVGDPSESQTTLAPLSSRQAADEVREKIRQAVAHGATALEVGPVVPRHSAFVQPTILTGITPDNPAYHWEFFGPVSMLFCAKDDEDAVRIANDSPFGLGGSVFSSDVAHGKAVAARISTGMVFVNHPTMVKADLPFGGVRRSGHGRELIDLGLMEFVNHKLVAVADIHGNF
jgi:succinate-semialdehyde dehydrogenase / glutarate-semialdehyde dehydrogenase